MSLQGFMDCRPSIGCRNIKRERNSLARDITGRAAASKSETALNDDGKRDHMDDPGTSIAMLEYALGIRLHKIILTRTQRTGYDGTGDAGLREVMCHKVPAYCTFRAVVSNVEELLRLSIHLVCVQIDEAICLLQPRTSMICHKRGLPGHAVAIPIQSGRVYNIIRIQPLDGRLWKPSMGANLCDESLLTRNAFHLEV